MKQETRNNIWVIIGILCFLSVNGFFMMMNNGTQEKVKRFIIETHVLTGKVETLESLLKGELREKSNPEHGHAFTGKVETLESLLRGELKEKANPEHGHAFMGVLDHKHKRFSGKMKR